MLCDDSWVYIYVIILGYFYVIIFGFLIRCGVNFNIQSTATAPHKNKKSSDLLRYDANQ